MESGFDYGFVSADSHVTEPPDCYSRFIEPAFRVPSRPKTVDFVDRLPRQDNGKLYRERLREQYRSQAS